MIDRRWSKERRLRIVEAVFIKDNSHPKWDITTISIQDASATVTRTDRVMPDSGLIEIEVARFPRMNGGYTIYYGREDPYWQRIANQYTDPTTYLNLLETIFEDLGF